MAKEHELQNTIRLEISKQQLGTIFRANVGRGWTGQTANMVLNPQVTRLTLTNPRPFSTGLPIGFPDLFGLKPIAITPDMVGQHVAIFVALEVKDTGGRVSEKQKNMLSFLQQQGARAGVVRSVADAVRILNGEESNDSQCKAAGRTK
jgi:hypothetical protein